MFHKHPWFGTVGSTCKFSPKPTQEEPSCTGLALVNAGQEMDLAVFRKKIYDGLVKSLVHIVTVFVLKVSDGKRIFQYTDLIRQFLYTFFQAVYSVTNGHTVLLLLPPPHPPLQGGEGVKKRFRLGGRAGISEKFYSGTFLC